MKEIITLQYGKYSNYVGSHFWNFQVDNFSPESFHVDSKDEINPNVLLRCGQTEKGSTTFTPRVIVFDTKDSLGSLRKGGYLYHQDAYKNDTKETLSVGTWSGNIGTYHETSYPSNPYLSQFNNEEEDEEEDEEEEEDESHEQKKKKKKQQQQLTINFEKNVNKWSDYLKAHYHPRSIMEINEFQPFDNLHNYYEGDHETGKLALNTYEESWDKIRQYLEECDHIEGIHCLVDIDSSYGSFASNCLKELKEECRSLTINCIAMDYFYGNYNCDQMDYKKQFSRTSINMALALSSLIEYSSLLIPVSSTIDQSYPSTFFNVSNKMKSHPYTSSALIAAGIEMISIPYRKRFDSISMHEMASSICESSSSCPFASLSCQLPYSRNLKSFKEIEPWKKYLLDYSFLPSYSLKKDNTIDSIEYFTQWINIRGTNQIFPTVSYYDIKKEFSQFLHDNIIRKWKYLLIKDSLHLPETFPKKYIDPLNTTGSIEMISTLSTNNAIPVYLNDIINATKSISYGILHEYNQYGMHLDDLKNITNQLETLTEYYHKS